MNEYDDITVLREELDEKSECGTACPPQFHMVSGSAPQVNAASYHALNKAYSDLKKRFNSLDHKYSALKKSCFDNQHLMHNGDVRADVILGSVCGPPSDHNRVGVPAYGSAPQMHSPVTRTASLERHIYRQEAEIKTKNDEIIRFRAAADKSSHDLKHQKHQFDKKIQAQRSEIAYLCKEIEKLKSEKDHLVKLWSTNGKVSSDDVGRTQVSPAFNQQDENVVGELDSVKLELSKYKAEQQALMKIVQDQSCVIKSLLNQARQRFTGREEDIVVDRHFQSESNKTAEKQNADLTSQSQNDAIVLHDAKGKKLLLASQKPNILGQGMDLQTSQETNSNRVRSRGSSPIVDSEDPEVFMENCITDRDNTAQRGGEYVNGIDKAPLQLTIQRRDTTKSKGDDTLLQTSLSIDSPEDDTISKNLPKRYNKSSFYSVSSEERTHDYGVEPYVHQRSKSTSALPASRPKELSPPMQNCPVCREDFPHIGVSDFQQHVLECMEVPDAMSLMRPTTPGAESKNHRGQAEQLFSGPQTSDVENRLKTSQAANHFPKPLNIDRNEFTDTVSSGDQNQQGGRLNLNLSTQLNNVDVGSSGITTGNDLLKNMSSSAQHNIYVENKDNNVMEPVKEERICPVCSAEFPHSSYTEMQAHVLDCSDSTNQDKVCPMCSRHFPDTMAESVFVNHVQSHFDNENVLEFEVVDYT